MEMRFGEMKLSHIIYLNETTKGKNHIIIVNDSEKIISYYRI